MTNPEATIYLNITDDQGILLGRISMTAGELATARSSSVACTAIVEDIASEAGIR